MHKVFIAAALSLAALAGSVNAQGTRSVSIIEPKDGATVSSPFTVKFDVRGMKVAPAGEPQPGVGHHHLLINGEPVAKGEEILFTRRNLHFNQGQTEAQVNLPPGNYKLTAQFGDGSHKSMGPEYSHTISVTVR
jgi:hypothetical protein